MTLRVAVVGAAGRMGRTVCETIAGADDTELVAAVDPMHAGSVLEIDGTVVTVTDQMKSVADGGAQVVVDFTNTESARTNLEWCALHDVHAVVGTSGLHAGDLERLRELFAGPPNCIVVPNFAIGAVLMMRFAEMAAPWFETAEVVELHHNKKIDAPSGTATATAQRMLGASGDWAEDPTQSITAEGARGARVGDGVNVHSLRLAGALAHQEVLLGGEGQLLTIRHDTFDRAAFMPGVLLAVRGIADLPGLTVGLDALLL